jgi:hypothetical protein
VDRIDQSDVDLLTFLKRRVDILLKCPSDQSEPFR